MEIHRKRPVRWRQVKRSWQIYLLLVLPLAWYFLFAYYPMSGLQLAFKSYHAQKGIWGSEWIGFLNYTLLFRDTLFWRSVSRTILANLGRLAVCFPFPILLALMLNELRMPRYKKTLQSVFTFPYFLSWVIVASLMINLFSTDGLFNIFMKIFTGNTVNVLGNEKIFWVVQYLTNIWRNAGYSMIIYMAAIVGIDQDQYEAAELDGASRLQTILHVTLPNILPTVSILFILTCGNLMTEGFDQAFNLSNSATRRVAEILDMYIYRVTFSSSMSIGYSSAVALFRSVLNMLFLLISNTVSKKLSGSGLLG